MFIGLAMLCPLGILQGVRRHFSSKSLVILPTLGGVITALLMLFSNLSLSFKLKLLSYKKKQLTENGLWCKKIIASKQINKKRDQSLSPKM